MALTTFAGHPIHPMLIVLPAGLIPFSLVLDLLYAKTKKKSYADASYYALAGGFFGGLLAGVAGVMDYFAIPEGSHSKQIATFHGLLNLGLIAVIGIGLLYRRQKMHQGKGASGLALSGVGTAWVLFSAWYGGHLVYEHGIRVQGEKELTKAEVIKPPYDEKVSRFLEKIPKWVLPGSSGHSGSGDQHQHAE